MSFNKLTKSYQIYSTNSSIAGIYNLRIIASLNDPFKSSNSSFTWTLNITEDNASLALPLPVFQEPLTDQSVLAGFTLNYSLPRIINTAQIAT